MSHTLYLVRHGIAEDASSEGGDAERALTTEGKRRMKEIARGLQKMDVAPSIVLTSPLRRARETAEIVHGVIAPDAPLNIYPPLDNAHPIEEIVSRLPSERSHQIMLVGHQPSLGELASYLLTGSAGLVPLPFKKGGVAAIVVYSIPPRSPGALEWLLTPKQLRAIGA